MAIVSDDIAEVTAMNSIKRIAIPPPRPSNAVAAYGNAMPVDASLSVILRG